MSSFARRRSMRARTGRRSRGSGMDSVAKAVWLLKRFGRSSFIRLEIDASALGRGMDSVAEVVRSRHAATHWFEPFHSAGNGYFCFGSRHAATVQLPATVQLLLPYFLLLELFSKSFLRKQPNQLVTGWAVSLYKNVFVSVVGYLSTTLPLFTF